MRKVLFVLFLGFLLMNVSGCGKGHSSSTYSHELSGKDMPELDLADNGEVKIRTIDQLCTHDEPLVYRENEYNESGELVQSQQYEYDECNRYKVVYNYKRDVDTSDMYLYLREEYSYDDYFYYKDITYAQTGLMAREIYDNHNNLVIQQYPNKTYDDALVEIYTYQYPIDTDKTEEEYKYRGEGLVFQYHTVRRFNRQGDETYYMHRGSYEITSIQTRYEYDNDGLITSKQETKTVEGLVQQSTLISDTAYYYNDQRQLILEEEKRVPDQGAGFETASGITIQYEYDEKGRLWKKTTEMTEESSDPQYVVYKFTIEYDYEP